ncbi:MAG: hypothetical protein V4534_08060 [Myxococcota bacterium]
MKYILTLALFSVSIFANPQVAASKKEDTSSAFLLGGIYEASLAGGSVYLCSKILSSSALNAAGIIVAPPIILGMHAVNVADGIEEIISWQTGHVPYVRRVNGYNPLLIPGYLVSTVLDYLALPRYLSQAKSAAFDSGRQAMAKNLVLVRAAVSAVAIYQSSSLLKSKSNAVVRSSDGLFRVCNDALNGVSRDLIALTMRHAKLTSKTSALTGQPQRATSPRLHLAMAMSPHLRPRLLSMGLKPLNPLALKALEILAAKSRNSAALLIGSVHNAVILPFAYAMATNDEKSSLISSGYKIVDEDIVSLISYAVPRLTIGSQLEWFANLLAEGKWTEAYQFVTKTFSKEDVVSVINVDLDRRREFAVVNLDPHREFDGVFVAFDRHNGNGEPDSADVTDGAGAARTGVRLRRHAPLSDG